MYAQWWLCYFGIDGSGILVPSLSLGQWSDQIDKIDTDMFVFEYIWLRKCGEFGLKFYQHTVQLYSSYQHTVHMYSSRQIQTLYCWWYCFDAYGQNKKWWHEWRIARTECSRHCEYCELLIFLLGQYVLGLWCAELLILFLTECFVQGVIHRPDETILTAVNKQWWVCYWLVDTSYESDLWQLMVSGYTLWWTV